MYLFKKNIILVPADFDGISMAKGILSLDCYADKTVCSIRTYNLFINKPLTLGICVNKKMSKFTVNGGVNSQKFDLNMVLGNSDHVSVVLLDIKQPSYDIVLWGSTELNASWRSTLEFMLDNEYGKNEQIYQTQQTETKDCLYNTKDVFTNNDQIVEEMLNNVCNREQICKQSIQVFNDIKPTEQKQSINFNEQSVIDTTEILKNNNLDDFLESVISMEQDDTLEFDDSVGDIDYEQPKQESFYDRISYQIDKMFNSNQQENILNDIIPNSKFCRVEFDDKSGHYVFGVVYEQNNPKYLCYGVPAKRDIEPPKELTNFYQWLPVDIEDDFGDGYYMMYQDALTGKNISVEVI